MKTMTRSLLPVALLATVFLLLPSVATAALAVRAALAVEPSIGPPTSLVKAKGSGFGADEVVALLFDRLRVGSDVASRTGKFNARFTVPAARYGERDAGERCDGAAFEPDLEQAERAGELAGDEAGLAAPLTR